MTATASSTTSTGSTCAASPVPSTELHDDGEDFHGTAVASVIAAATDGAGMAGVAPDAELMAVRWLINNTCMDTDMAAAAIEYAVDEGADVINASWGSEQPSATLLNAVHYAEDANVLIVAAAGNEVGINFYPAKYATPNVLSVAAIRPSGYLASFSNRGSWVDMAAPGQSILVACVSGVRRATRSPTGRRSRRRTSRESRPSCWT